jgi:hypothetical protein
MREPTLDHFLKDRWSSNQYVRFPGFAKLYVRKSTRRLGDREFPCVDIANAAARVPGGGAFKSLVAHLRSDYGDRAIFAENVHNLRLRTGLLRMGFRPTECPISFLLLPTASAQT